MSPIPIHGIASETNLEAGPGGSMSLFWENCLKVLFCCKKKKIKIKIKIKNHPFSIFFGHVMVCAPFKISGSAFVQ